MLGAEATVQNQANAVSAFMEFVDQGSFSSNSMGHPLCPQFLRNREDPNSFPKTHQSKPVLLNSVLKEIPAYDQQYCIVYLKMC